VTGHAGESGKLLAFDPDRLRCRVDIATTTISRAYARGSSGAVRAPRLESLPELETCHVEPVIDAVAAPYLQPALDPVERTPRRAGRLWIAIVAAIGATSALVWLTQSL